MVERLPGSKIVSTQASGICAPSSCYRPFTWLNSRGVPECMFCLLLDHRIVWSTMLVIVFLSQKFHCDLEFWQDKCSTFKSFALTMHLEFILKIKLSSKVMCLNVCVQVMEGSVLKAQGGQRKRWNKPALYLHLCGWIQTYCVYGCYLCVCSFLKKIVYRENQHIKNDTKNEVLQKKLQRQEAWTSSPNSITNQLRYIW